MNGYTHYDLAAIGNDEAAFEVLTQAADSGRRCLALLPDARHSSWLCSLALRNLAANCWSIEIVNVEACTTVQALRNCCGD